jgi:hypothetical protein
MYILANGHRCLFPEEHITFGTVELDAGLGELVQGLGQVKGLHTAQLGTHSFHSLYSSTIKAFLLRAEGKVAS